MALRQGCPHHHQHHKVRVHIILNGFIRRTTAPPQRREYALINAFRCFIHLPFLLSFLFFFPSFSSFLPSVSTGKALAMANSTLFSQAHGKDRFAVSDVAYGYSGLVMVDPYDQVRRATHCTHCVHTYLSTIFSVVKCFTLKYDKFYSTSPIIDNVNLQLPI